MTPERRGLREDPEAARGREAEGPQARVAQGGLVGGFGRIVHYEQLAGQTVFLTWLQKMSANSAGHIFTVIWSATCSPGRPRAPSRRSAPRPHSRGWGAGL